MATEPELSLSVLIPTFHRPLELRRALRAVAAQSRPPGEVLVVIRPEDTESLAVAAEAENLAVRVVPVERPGVVAARNAGLDVATSDVVAFLDDDAVPARDWLERMLGWYDDEGVGAVGGRDQVFHGDIPVDEGVRHDVGTLTWYGRFVALHHRGAGAARDVDHLKGVNMSYRRSRAPDVRVDEWLRGNGAEVHEEASLCLQVKRRGLRVVYDPEIRVDHFEADRGDLDGRQPREYRARRDRQHNQTFVVARYFPLHRTAVHLLFTMLVGSGEAPGLVITARNIARQKTLRGQAVPLLANLSGRCLGVMTAIRATRRHKRRSRTCR